jgi:ADP-glucose pyrophosphorylase
VGRGTTVRDSIIFFNNRVDEGCRFNKVISDVNNTFGSGCFLGEERDDPAGKTTVIGWSNTIPAGTVFESGSTLYPELAPQDIPQFIADGKVMR